MVLSIFFKSALLENGALPIIPRPLPPPTGWTHSSIGSTRTSCGGASARPTTSPGPRVAQRYPRGPVVGPLLFTHDRVIPNFMTREFFMGHGFSCHPHGFRGRRSVHILPALHRRPAPGPGPRPFWPPSLPHITAAKVTRQSAHPTFFSGALHLAPHRWLCAASVGPETGANKYVSCRYS